MVLSLSQTDRNRMDSDRVSTVDVPESPISSGARGRWEQQRCDFLHCHEERWGSVPPSVVVFSWVHVFYNLVAKVKVSLRRTWYNTRHELIHSIVRSIRNMNKDGRADGVRRLPNIWQKVISIGATILNIKPCQTYRIVAITCYLTHVPRRCNKNNLFRRAV